MKPGPKRLNGSEFPPQRAIALHTALWMAGIFAVGIFLDQILPLIVNALTSFYQWFESTLISWWTGWSSHGHYREFDVPAPEFFTYELSILDTVILKLMFVGLIAFVAFIALAAAVIVPKILEKCTESPTSRMDMCRSAFCTVAAAFKDFVSKLRCRHAIRAAMAAIMAREDDVQDIAPKSDVLTLLRERLVLSRIGAITAG